MNFTEELLKAEGNPGAMNFISQGIAMAQKSVDQSSPLLDAMNRIPSLRGANIYILCSDLCGGDFEKIDKLCNDCPDDILADACNRQDRSGVELVKEYL